MSREKFIAEKIGKILEKQFPDDAADTKIGALMFAAAQTIARTSGSSHEEMELVERFGRAFDRILLMELSINESESPE